MPAGGPPRSEAGSGLPGAIPVPGLLLPLPPALGVSAIVGQRPWGERGDLKAVIKDAESKLPVALRQREEVLVHVLREEGRDRGPLAWAPQLLPTVATVLGSGLQGTGRHQRNLGAHAGCRRLSEEGPRMGSSRDPRALAR